MKTEIQLVLGFSALAHSTESLDFFYLIHKNSSKINPHLLPIQLITSEQLKNPKPMSDMHLSPFFGWIQGRKSPSALNAEGLNLTQGSS
jgi:hypothetical protein